ncbi:MAG: ribbon-helix-helix domain-containing protein [Defluviicoccus sp.]|nr:ribbon-helix-helix domain-containing protein [Defluviicoccus sp.]
MSRTRSGLDRRTLTVSGHRTSVALEPAFWEELAAIAKSRGLTIAALVTEIDAARPGSLASAIRVRVVEGLREAVSCRAG